MIDANRTTGGKKSDERGSALLMAVFVLALLSSMVIALLFLSGFESAMSTAGTRSTRAYYLAETAVEAGRQALFNTNGDGTFDDDLLAWAGIDGEIDFDPLLLSPTFDAQGQLTALGGFDDDDLLQVLTPFGGGWYAAFLTNDPDEALGVIDTNDTNQRVMITGVGSAGDGSFEIVQAIVEKRKPFPSEVPAAVVMFGPNPSFSDSDNVAKVFNGNDCAGTGVPGLTVPVAGLIGTPAETIVEGSLSANTTYTSGANSGDGTVADLTDPTDPGISASFIGTIDPAWTSCNAMRGMTEGMRARADVICVEGSGCTLPASSPGRVVFSDGDFTLDSSLSGAGMLWVTGTLTMEGSAEWDGLIVVVGEGAFVRNGGGTGKISGATIVADIAGPDNLYGTSDDCSGGTNGFDQAVYNETAGGTGETVYCSTDVVAATPNTKYAVVEFLQR